MAQPLDRARLLEAFKALGSDLADHGQFVELSVYGGGALMLQFAWRRSTEVVDAVVRAGYDEAALAPSVRRVAERMGFEPDCSTMRSACSRPSTRTSPCSRWPAPIRRAAPRSPDGPGDTVLSAGDETPCARKPRPRRPGSERRARNDARALAAHLNIGAVETLDRLYRSIYGEAPPPEARARFRNVVGANP